MLDRETIEFLEGGCALIVGTVAPDGQPFANRGWGLTVLEPDHERLHLVLDARDVVTIDNIRTTGRLAVTGTDVLTLRSMQAKGRATGVQPANDADRARAEEFCDAFFTDVVESDGTDRRLLERFVPLDFVTCDVTVEEFYDQTPGPGAGNAMSRVGS